MSICLTKGDTGIGFRATLYNGDRKINLDGADVMFKFGGHEITPKIESDNNLLVVFEAVHTEKTGIFRGQFKVTHNDGRIETYPSHCESKIMINVGE